MADPGLWTVAGEGWTSGELAGDARLDGGRLTLTAAPDAAVDRIRAGTWTGGFACPPCDRVLLSLNPDPFPTGAEVRARVRVQLEGDAERSPWFPLGVYGPGPDLPRSERGEPWRGVRVMTDLLRAREAPIVRVEVQLELRARSTAPRLRRLAISQWRGKAQPAPPTRSPAWGITLEPPQRSQCVEDRAIAGRICSPTSLGMALTFLGRPQSTLDTCAGVYDHGAEIYGNWSFNAAYAATQGFAATALHLDGLAAIEAEVAAGRPVVISHKWAAGEMSQTPTRASDGHLILVVGFTAEGDVVVHDPAADPRDAEAIRRVYPRAEVQRSWLRNGEGVAYVLRPVADAR